MKIALWGYKEFGRRLSESLKKYWEGKYIVTGIYDAACCGRQDPFWDIDVSEPGQIKEDHDKGVFEKVIVCVVDKPLRDGIIANLNAQGIQELFPGDPADFVSPEEFGAEVIYLNDDCTINRYRNTYVAHADHLSWECAYIFDREGRILMSPWNINEWYDPEIPLVYPFPLKDPMPEKIHMPGSYCLLTRIFGNNYWHFTFQNLCDAYILEKNGFTGTYIISNAKHNRELMIMMGIAPERILSIDTLEFHKVYVFEEIYAVQIDHSNAVFESRIVAEAARKIRNSLKRDPAYPRFVYVKRIGARKLTNGDDIAEKHGFVTIIPEQLSVKEQMEHFYNADIVLCPHGANSTNCLYMHENSVFIEIFSDRWYNDLNSDVCRENHVHHLKVVGKAANMEEIGIHDDYMIPEKDINPVIMKAYELAEDPSKAASFIDTREDDPGDILPQSEGILIYGAWILGDQAYEMLNRVAKDKILGFAVTAISGNPEEKQGYPVRTVQEWRQVFDDRNIPPDQIAVVMALNPRFYAEVNALLKNNSFEHIFELKDIERYYRKQLSEKKKYQTGLLMGVFDLFHIGHLNLIKRAKSRCRYLRIGVLSDELTHEFKDRYPVIPQNERIKILAALKDVDEVVLLENKEDVYRPNEWKKRPFDCFFSGDDYADNEYWKKERVELQKLGADMEFFGYTKERSSTMIREEIKKREGGR